MRARRRVGLRKAALVAGCASALLIAPPSALAAQEPQENPTLEVHPRICENSDSSRPCPLEFLIHTPGPARRVCLFMDDDGIKELACATGRSRWRHQLELRVTKTTRFFLKESGAGQILAEARVESVDYVPEVRPRRRHAWFSL